jgi:peptidoglycan/LPS O-acetylase OafA/YrhL
MQTFRRDDRIFVETRLVAGAVILVLLLAFVALYLFPQDTDTDFAWTVTPATTALLMGAGYLAGAYFFLRVLTEQKWHRVQAGFLPITAFTLFLLGATLLHWSRFHQGAFQFYLWTGIYLVTPFLVPFLWWRNHATDPGTLEQNDLELSPRMRRTLEVVGWAGAAVMVLGFVQPSLLMAVAPWRLTELTARVGAGWGALTALTVASIGHDGRWSAARILVESGTIGPALMLLALTRSAGDLAWTSLGAWVFVGALGAALVFFVLVHLWLDRQTNAVQPAT